VKEGTRAARVFWRMSDERKKRASVDLQQVIRGIVSAAEKERERPTPPPPSGVNAPAPR
jgi:hypothetical protein